MKEEDNRAVKVSATDRLANERTFLAWVRTALGAVAFGFVIVKFSLFVTGMRLLFDDKAGLSGGRHFRQDLADFTGITMISLGCLMLILGYIRYRRTEKNLMNGTLVSDKMLPLLTTVSLIVVILMLVSYLIF
jgi:putative membrane protein